MAGRRIPGIPMQRSSGDGGGSHCDGTSGLQSAVIVGGAARTQMSISTSFLSPPDESESRTEGSAETHTQRDGMHKQGVASRTLC